MDIRQLDRQYDGLFAGDGSQEPGRQLGLADGRGGDRAGVQQDDVRPSELGQLLQGALAKTHGDRECAVRRAVFLGGDGHGDHQVGATVHVEPAVGGVTFQR